MSLTDMYPAKNGSPVTTTTASLNSSDTSMTLADASVLPSAPNIAVLGSDENAEIVKYTAINSNTVTIVRGQNGTTPGVWPSGTTVARNFTAMDHEAFRENILDLNTRKTDTGHTHDDRYYTETEMDTALALKANLASPAFTGTPTSAATLLPSDDSTSLATTAFVHDRGLLHLTIQVASAGTAKSYNCSAITSTMYVINCVFGTPSNVTSDITWTTTTGNITFNGTFAGSTTIDCDLIEADTATVTPA